MIDPFVVSSNLINNKFKLQFIDSVLTTTTVKILASTVNQTEPTIATTAAPINAQWIEYNGNWYFFNDFHLVQSEAEKHCNYFESTLAEITDFDQLNFLVNNLMINNNQIWVT